MFPFEKNRMQLFSYQLPVQYMRSIIIYFKQPLASQKTTKLRS